MIAISMLYIYTPYSVTLVPKKGSYFHNFQIRTELLKKKTVPATRGNSKHILPSEIKKHTASTTRLRRTRQQALTISDSKDNK